jgi:ABC-type sugar transport system substrate-binding protein
MGVIDAVLLGVKSHRPVIIGVDSNDYIDNAISRGYLAGTVLQKPEEMGFIGIKLIHDKLKNGTPLKSVTTGLKFDAKSK